jgi:hypothetical protein
MLAAGRTVPRVAALAGACAMLAACSMGSPERAGLSCVDDSPECVQQRQATLKAMLAEQDRGWVKEPPTLEAHASGVRLFAFRTKRAELSCEELGVGRREAEGAPKALKGAASQGLSPAQIARASAFANEVGRELAGEMRKRRCRA